MSWVRSGLDDDHQGVHADPGTPHSSTEVLEALQKGHSVIWHKSAGWISLGTTPVRIVLHDARVSMETHRCLPKLVYVCELTHNSANRSLQQDDVLRRWPAAILLQQRDCIETCMCQWTRSQ